MRGSDREDWTIPPDGRPAEEQPAWRLDFPIDLPQDQYIARREFTKFLALTSFAFAMGQVWILVKSRLGHRPPSRPVAVARLSELPVGASRQFDYPERGDSRILVRLADREVVAFDARCTHLSCPVIPDVANGRLRCPCHHGFFELATGRPLAGPPSRPLPRVLIELRGDEVVATGVETRLT
jgi:Rieske Fe-S protein